MVGAFDLLVQWLLAWEDLLRTSPTAPYFWWLGLRSVAIGALCGGLFGGLVAALPGLAGRSLRPSRAFAFVFGLTTAAVIFLHRSAILQLEQLGALPISATDRHLAVAVAAGQALLSGVAAGFGARLLISRLGLPASPLRRMALLAFAALLLTLIADLGLRRGAGEPLPGAPSKVVVVGLDGLTFRALSPLLRAGEAPAFLRLIDEGAWGSWMTYGTASSPRVWTSMATGQRVRDHGIDDFVRPVAGRYRTLPLKSTDWKARAIWDILGDRGKRVGVVDWLLTFPPQPVAGYMVPRLHLRGTLRTHPPRLGRELRRTLDPVLEARNQQAPPNRRRLLRKIDRTFDTAELLLAKEPLDLLLVFSAAADAAEHTTWKAYQPEAFDPEIWPLVHGTEHRANLIPAVYRHFDLRLGQLQEKLGSDTLLIVASDHGQRAARRPRTRFRLDRLLADLGYARMHRSSDGELEIDLERSRAYTLAETPWTPALRVNLNQKGREPNGRVRRRKAPGMLRELAAHLRSLRFTDGDRVFGPVTVRADDPSADPGADLSVQLSAALHDPASRSRSLRLGDSTRPLRRYLEIDRSISGEHDHQGVLFLHGPGVRPGPIGQRMIPTAFHRLLWHLTDKVDSIDPLLPLLQWAGILDRATTLDLTPTVLHALGQPVARDMEGRPMPRALPNLPAVRWIDSYEAPPTPTAPAPEDASDEEVLERLRSLGYVG